ncbi:MAG: hypothetical protein PHV36_15125 [Elusimicrobiales bacterium]|nr:hypothetical protein [Elusimicrobiales bacterium]
MVFAWALTVASPCLAGNPAQRWLGLISGAVTAYSSTKEARMENILWQTPGGKPHHRWMYFQDGPEFHPDSAAAAAVWARYKDGAIAALQAPYGKGPVGLMGPHPEAGKTWWSEDHLTDPYGTDTGLFTEFIRALDPC